MVRQAEDILGPRLNEAGGHTLDMINMLMSREADLKQAEGTTARTGDYVGTKGALGITLAGLLASIIGGDASIAEGTMAGVLGQAQETAQAEQERVDKQAQTLREELRQGRAFGTTLFQTRPEAFLGPDGSDLVDPVVLGRALTGMPIPLSAASMVQNITRTKNEELIQGAMIRQLISAETVAGRRAALDVLDAAARWGLSDEVKDQIAALDPADGDGRYWALMYQSLDPLSVTHTLVQYLIHGESIADNPERLLDIGPRPSDVKQTVDDVILSRAGELTQWVRQDPENRAGLDPLDAASVYWREDPGALALWNNKFASLAEKDVTPGQVMQVYLAAVSARDMLRAIAPGRANDLYGEAGSEREFRELSRMVNSSLQHTTNHMKLTTAANVLNYTRVAEARIRELLDARITDAEERNKVRRANMSEEDNIWYANLLERELSRIFRDGARMTPSEIREEIEDLSSSMAVQLMARFDIGR